MPCIRDKSTIEAIAREFVSNGRCKQKALESVGYTENYAHARGLAVMFGNDRVKAEIARLDGETIAKYEHSRDKHVELLLYDYANLATKAQAGDIGAIQARTAIMREMSNVCHLGGTTVHADKPEQAMELSKADIAMLQAMSKKLNEADVDTPTIHKLVNTA